MARFMKKKRLLVDVDDTLINNLWNEGLNGFLGTNFKREEIKTYSVDKYITTDEERSRFLNYIKDKSFYDGCRIIEDAVRVMKKLYEKYDLYICSACVLNIGKGYAYTNSYQQKFDILRKYFPFISPERFIFTQNKNIIKADIIIDDSLYNFYGDEELKLMYNCFMNDDVDEAEIKNLNIRRVNSWKEIEDILL